MGRSARLIRSIPGCALIGALVFFGGAPVAEAQTVCEFAPSQQFSLASGQVRELAPNDDRAESPPPINFGADRNIRRPAPYLFKPVGDGPQPDLEALSWDVVLVNLNNEEFPADQIAVSFTRSFETVKVRVCLNARSLPSGSYVGALTFGGGNVKPRQIPMTVNLKDNNIPVLAMGIVLVAFAAVFYKWWMDKIADSSARNAPRVQDFWRWLRDEYVTVLIAVGGAAGLVVWTKYINSTSFTAGDRPALWIAVFTAVTAAALLGSAIAHHNDAGDRGGGNEGGREARGVAEDHQDRRDHAEEHEGSGAR